MYDFPPARTAVIFPCLSHSLLCCIQTVSPTCSSLIVAVWAFLYRTDLSCVLSLPCMLACTGVWLLLRGDSWCFCFLPQKSWLGETPSSLGMFLQAATAAVKLSLLRAHRVTKLLRFLTAASARPLRSGLYGDESSCFILFVLQNSVNLFWNCGPLSAQCW